MSADAGAGRVDVWWIDLASAATPAQLEALDAFERERAARLRHAADRRRYERRHAAVRAILAPLVGEAPDALAIDRRCSRCGHPTHGKPRVAGDGGPAFSVAASGDLAVLAVSGDLDLGVDLERADRLAGAAGDLEAMTRVAFTPAEQATALGAPGEGPPDPGRFLRAWVRKEALAKAIGAGLVAEAAEIDTTRLAGTPWRLHDVDAAPGHLSALAVDGDLRRLEHHAWPGDR